MFTYLVPALGGRGRKISTSSRVSWSTQRVPGQPELLSETLSQGKNKQTNTETSKFGRQRRAKGSRLSSILILYEREKKHYIKRWEQRHQDDESMFAQWRSQLSKSK